MSDMLSIGASGVRAYQSALGVTSDNIANAGTAGYTRRTVALREVAASGSVGLNTQIARSGNGVVVNGVVRQSDAYQTASIRLASTDLARTEAGTAQLERVQSVLTQGATTTRMNAFFAASQKLAADPTSTAARASMIEAGQGVADAFRTTGRGLDEAAAELDGRIDAGARELTSLAGALAKINEGMGRAAPGSAAAANLADQRDRILGDMSAVADVSARIDDFGRTTLRVGGSNGAVLVSGNEAATVVAGRNEDGALAFSVRRGSEEQGFVPTGGALAGFAEGAQRIVDARAGLNQVAGKFAKTVNDVLKTGDDLNGEDGGALFTAGTPASEMSLAFTDPAKLAAAGRDKGPRDASNLADLQKARTASGVEEAGTALVAGVATAIESRKTVAAAQGAINDAAVAALDAKAGVDLDQEAVDLIRFQQAYQASSRVIQVARDVMQTLLEIR